jgi:hypothetical protein
MGGWPRGCSIFVSFGACRNWRRCERPRAGRAGQACSEKLGSSTPKAAAAAIAAVRPAVSGRQKHGSSYMEKSASIH